MYYSWNRAVIGNEYILALAIAVSGAVIALLSLPSRYCLRLPSPPEQETHPTSRAIRTTLSVLAVGCGLPIDLFELLVAWATLLGTATSCRGGRYGNGCGALTDFAIRCSCGGGAPDYTPPGNFSSLRN